MPTQIHSTAIVSSKAQLADGVSVEPYAIIEDDVIIDEGTYIGPHTLIANGARIGKNCKIHNGAVVSTAPQDLSYKNEPTTFELGDNSTIREFCTLNRGTVKQHQKSTVGSNCLLMAYTHVAHDCIIGNNVIIANSVQMAGHVTIQDYAIIGGMTAIHQFVNIGAYTMIGGHFRIPKDIPPYIMAGGWPVSFERLNIIGLKRRGFTQEAIESLNDAYRILYLSNLNVSQGVEKIKSTMTIT
ncbi:MAG TPA: acyl-[acyl-carrier-protein]--UDP-N-acetylglucosamine O-acyltransferase, partial [Bacteroidetes bacterium]|nr:acyl-[acyl-carrier-protein]--UDP-N-acetylglucosamine O-acyltransferase [Bacteroidota bacterium]